MKVQLLCDNRRSWIIPFMLELADKVGSVGHECSVHYEHSEVEAGDVLCLLSCEKIFKSLHLNRHNLVVHESFLPKGKGWSPLTWQVLEGKSEIPVTLFEATEAVDAGVIYNQQLIQLDGTELLPEIKEKQGKATIKLILDFLVEYPHVKGKPQVGEESFYSKRSVEDSQLDASKSIAEQFDLLRVCDNDRYPAYFIYRNQKYILKIEKDDK